MQCVKGYKLGYSPTCRALCSLVGAPDAGYGQGMPDSSLPPDRLHAFAQGAVCCATGSGWLWYCDEHDTHGNADSEAEAETLAEVHSDFFDEDYRERCTTIVWRRTSRASAVVRQ